MEVGVKATKILKRFFTTIAAPVLAIYVACEAADGIYKTYKYISKKGQRDE